MIHISKIALFCTFYIDLKISLCYNKMSDILRIYKRNFITQLSYKALE